MAWCFGLLDSGNLQVPSPPPCPRTHTEPLCTHDGTHAQIAMRHQRVPYHQCPAWAYREAKSRGRLREGVGPPIPAQQQQQAQQLQQQLNGGGGPMLGSAQFDQELLQRWGVEAPTAQGPTLARCSSMGAGAIADAMASGGQRWASQPHHLGGLGAHEEARAQAPASLGGLVGLLNGAAAGGDGGGALQQQHHHQMARPLSGTLSSADPTAAAAARAGPNDASTTGSVVNGGGGHHHGHVPPGQDMIIARTSLNRGQISHSLLAQQQRGLAGAGGDAVDDTQPLVSSLYQHWAMQHGNGAAEPHTLLPPVLTGAGGLGGHHQHLHNLPPHDPPQQQHHAQAGGLRQQQARHASSNGATTTTVSNGHAATYSSSHGGGGGATTGGQQASAVAAAAAHACDPSLTTAANNQNHLQAPHDAGNHATSVGDVAMAAGGGSDGGGRGDGGSGANPNLASLLDEFKLPGDGAQEDAFGSLDLPQSPPSVGQSSHMQLGDPPQPLLQRSSLTLPPLLNQPTPMMAAHLQQQQQQQQQDAAAATVAAAVAAAAAATAGGGGGAVGASSSASAMAAAAAADVRPLPSSLKSSQTLATTSTPDFGAASVAGGGPLDMRASPVGFPGSASHGSQGPLGASLQQQQQQQQPAEHVQQQAPALSGAPPPHVGIHRSSPMPIGAAGGARGRGLGAIDELSGGGGGGDLSSQQQLHGGLVGVAATQPLPMRGAMLHHASATHMQGAGALGGAFGLTASDPMALSRGLVMAAANSMDDDPAMAAVGGVGSLASQLQLLQRLNAAAAAAAAPPPWPPRRGAAAPPRRRAGGVIGAVRRQRPAVHLGQHAALEPAGVAGGGQRQGLAGGSPRPAAQQPLHRGGVGGVDRGQGARAHQQRQPILAALCARPQRGDAHRAARRHGAGAGPRARRAAAPLQVSRRCRYCAARRTLRARESACGASLRGGLPNLACPSRNLVCPPAGRSGWRA